MNPENPPPKPAQITSPPRRVPGAVTWGFLIFLAVAVITLRLVHGDAEVGGLDNAAANLATYGAVILGGIALWAWFTFRSSYPIRWRRAAIVAGLVLAVALVASVRLDGITGNWIPTGVRWSWQKARDFDRPKIASAPMLSRKLVESTPEDFPQFLGPNRDNYLPNVQLSHDWSANPPALLWRKEVGAGWSGFAVVNKHAVTLEQYGNEEHITCRDLANGEVIWSHSVEARHEEFMGGIGPRSTPTIHESKVYAVGATGKVTCLHLSNGDLIWQEDLRQRYGLEAEEDLAMVQWGRTNSPLIYRDLCIVPAGGKSPVSLIAFDKQSGKVQWEGGSNQISYASPVMLTIAGREQIVSVNESNVTGHDPETGKELWSYPWLGRSNLNASASQPHGIGNDQILISKGYDEGSAVFRVTEVEGTFKTEKVWQEKRSLQTKFTNAVVHAGYAYGLSDGILQCVDLKNGKRVWPPTRAANYGHGQLLGAGDVLLVQTEKTGELVMVALDPKRHRELGRIVSLSTQSQSWNHLCLGGRRLLVRNADEAACWELK